MSVDTEISFLSTLEAELEEKKHDFANFHGGHFQNGITQVVHHESNISHRNL